MANKTGCMSIMYNKLKGGSYMSIVQYEHHGKTVSVKEEYKGKHRDICLCWQKCKHFKPENRAENCKTANAVYKNCVDFGIVSPVMECTDYEV